MRTPLAIFLAIFLAVFLPMFLPVIGRTATVTAQSPATHPTTAPSPTTTASVENPDWTDIKWNADAEKNGLIESIRKFSQGQTVDCRLSIEAGPGSPRIVTIRLLQGDKVVCSFKGSEQSEFLLIDKIFYYADFQSSAPGGSIVAVDLTTGKELWQSELKSITKAVSGSTFSNRIGLTALSQTTDNWKTHSETLAVWREEAGQRYLEIKNLKSGETIGHHLFDPRPAK